MEFSALTNLPNRPVQCLCPPHKLALSDHLHVEACGGKITLAETPIIVTAIHNNNSIE